MLFYTRRKMPDRFADVRGITAWQCKLVNHTWTEPARDGVFHTKHVTDLERRKYLHNIYIIAIALDGMANLFLSKSRKMAYVG